MAVVVWIEWVSDDDVVLSWFSFVIVDDLIRFYVLQNGVDRERGVNSDINAAAD